MIICSKLKNKQKLLKNQRDLFYNVTFVNYWGHNLDKLGPECLNKSMIDSI